MLCRRYCRVPLLSVILICAVVESPPPARAAQGDQPQTMHGFYRYKVRGLTAGAGVFSAMLFKVPGTYAAMVSRVVPGFFKILSGMAQVSNDPSAKEMHDFLRSGDLYGMDYSTIPITAGYGIEIEFTLELVKKEWQLKRGSYRWSSDHHFSVSPGEGSIVENVRGQGNGALDPKTSSITLMDVGKKGSPRLELAGNILITSGFVAGKSVWTNGPIRWAIDQGKGEVEIVMGGLAAVRDKLPGANEPVVGNFSFSKRVTPGVTGREVYQDLLDSGVVEEWELWSECSAAIEIPKKEDELSFDRRKPGRLTHLARAKVKPSFWEDDLHWEFEAIEGSTLDTPPEKANGNDFPITYTNLPEKNSAFKFGEVRARFDTERAKRARCKDPEPHKVGYFFALTGVNHGGPPGPRPDRAPSADRPNPNWLHYWMQTKAGLGLPVSFVRYGGVGGGCKSLLGENGYFLRGDKYIVVCDDAALISENPLAPDMLLEGIDAFAATVLHEKMHHDLYWKWWGAGYGTPDDPDNEILDSDSDGIPDLLESSLPVPPQVKSKTGRTKFSPKYTNSFGYKRMDDEHYLAYAAEFEWRPGSAKQEDWACPGQQTKALCR